MEKLSEYMTAKEMAERWGRGFDRIREACESFASTPLPEYDI